MKRAGAIASAVLLCASGVSPQEAEYLLRVDVPLVSLEAVVLDPNGRPFTGLGERDFLVLEDDEPQEIRHFDTVETPYSILLLFDNMLPSGERALMGDASNLFLRSLRPQDSVAVAAFDNEFRSLLDWRKVQTGEPVEVVVPAPPLQGIKAFPQALDSALAQFRDVPGRKGVIVMTDGNSTGLLNAGLSGVDGSRGRVADDPFPETLGLLDGANVPFYFVAVPPADRLVELFGRRLPNLAWPPGYLEAVRERLEELAEVSGGRVYFVEGAEDGLPLYEQIAEELGRSYSIAYSPALASTGTRRIDVRVSDPDLRVLQSRTSYTAR